MNKDELKHGKNVVKKYLKLIHSIPASEFQAMVNEYRREYEIKHLSLNDPQKDLRICVCVRKRPISKKELNKKDIDVLTIPNKDLYCCTFTQS